MTLNNWNATWALYIRESKDVASTPWTKCSQYWWHVRYRYKVTKLYCYVVLIMRLNAASDDAAITGHVPWAAATGNVAYDQRWYKMLHDATRWRSFCYFCDVEALPGRRRISLEDGMARKHTVPWQSPSHAVLQNATCSSNNSIALVTFLSGRWSTLTTWLLTAQSTHNTQYRPWQCMKNVALDRYRRRSHVSTHVRYRPIYRTRARTMTLQFAPVTKALFTSFD